MSIDNIRGGYGNKRFLIHRREFDMLAISIYYILPNHKHFVAKPIELEYVEVDEKSAWEPTLRFGISEAPVLLATLADQLDDNGIVPPSLEGLKGQIKAMELHLEDMRRQVKLGEDFIRTKI